MVDGCREAAPMQLAMLSSGMLRFTRKEYVCAGSYLCGSVYVNRVIILSSSRDTFGEKPLAERFAHAANCN